MIAREDALATVDQWFLPCEDFELWVGERGRGSAVIAVHGGPGVEHSDLVAPLLPLTATRRVLWYDQRGSLRSPYSSPEQLESISFEAHVEDLIRLAEETGPADILAHSAGTLLTMAAVRRRPELFRRLVLVGAPAPGTDEVPPAARQWLAERERLAAEQITALGLDREDRTPQEAQLAWRILFALSNAVREDAWQIMRWPGRAWYRVEVAERSTRGMSIGKDHVAALARHEHPVTVLIGDTDIVDFGVEHWGRLVAEHPGIDLRVVPSCGHEPWVDQPEAFRRHLLELLAA